jgi:hypothetical protein
LKLRHHPQKPVVLLTVEKFPAKAQRRKEKVPKRGSALRLGGNSS